MMYQKTSRKHHLWDYQNVVLISSWSYIRGSVVCKSILLNYTHCNCQILCQYHSCCASAACFTSICHLLWKNKFAEILMAFESYWSTILIGTTTLHTFTVVLVLSFSVIYETTTFAFVCIFPSGVKAFRNSDLPDRPKCNINVCTLT